MNEIAQKLRDLAGDLETYNVMSRYPQGLLDAADAIDAQAAEIAEAKGQIEQLGRQNNALRAALKPLAEIDLAAPPPNDFAWFVLRARAALQESSHD